MGRWSLEEWGLEHLKRTACPLLSPDAREVVGEILAASLNYRDLLVVQGLYNPRFPRPLVPGSDACVRIVAVGSEVSNDLVGKIALPLFSPKWTDGRPEHFTLRQTLGGPLEGVFQRYRRFLPQELVILEEADSLSPEEWATLPCAGVTAWNALFCVGQLKPGQTVLLLGTGGVSIFCLQLAKLAGARVLLLSSSSEKRARAESLGADSTYDYRQDPKWGDWVLGQTQGEGVDLVVEVGGAGTLTQSLKSVKIGGRISLLGILAGSKEPLNLLPLMMKAVAMQGVVVGHKRHLQQLLKAVVHNGLKPVVDSTYPESDLTNALNRLKTAKHFGKITISWS